MPPHFDARQQSLNTESFSDPYEAYFNRKLTLISSTYIWSQKGSARLLRLPVLRGFRFSWKQVPAALSIVSERATVREQGQVRNQEKPKANAIISQSSFNALPVLLNYYIVLNVPDWKKSNNLIKSIGMMEHSVNFHLNLQRFKCRRLFSEESVCEESVSFVINENILESRSDLIFFQQSGSTWNTTITSTFCGVLKKHSGISQIRRSEFSRSS